MARAPRDISEALKKKIASDIGSKVAKRLRALRCPEHAEGPTVRTRTAAGKLTFDVHACCDTLQKLVDQVIKDGPSPT